MNENDEIRERLNPIIDELGDRLEADLSPKDDLAIVTALVKASLTGFKVGAGHVAYSAHLQGVRLDVNYLAPGVDHDEWAETYGQEGAEG